ncbi:MAG TPA: GNAT family N-acetyltransferase [Verrucomicrobiae bacterium]|jgi:putative acetyltransferase|nr:GNAT family N-acetyltransferase [Verrucomicrobiae bacterium]
MIADDIEPILCLFETVAAERIYIGTEPGFDRAAYRARLERGLLRDAMPTWVVIADDAPSALTGTPTIGQLGIWMSDDDGPTLGMMIAPPFRGHGLGRLLLQTAMAWTRDAGYTTLALLVFPHNRAAIALYRAMGFEQVAYYERDVRRQNGEVWDTILMQQRLS